MWTACSIGKNAADLDAALDDVGQRLAVDVFHGDELVALFFGDIVDVHDARVIELRRQARLVEEHRHDARMLRVTRLQHLDDQVLLEAADGLLARDVELGHSSGREMTDDRVAADLAADDVLSVCPALHPTRILAQTCQLRLTYPYAAGRN